MTGYFSVRGFESRPVRQLSRVVLATVLVAALPACVTRVLSVETTPPGAQVFLDGQAVGTTPFEMEFYSYGTRRVELRLEGYRRLISTLDVARPWWQWFPVSLVADLLWPFPVRDEHRFAFELQPWEPGPADWEAAEAAWRRLQEHKRRVGDVDEAPEEPPGGTGSDG